MKTALPIEKQSPLPFDSKSYWEDRLTRSFGLHGVGYAGISQSYNYWLYQIKKRNFLKNIQSLQHDFTQSSVLDIGCGTGFFVQCWKELSCKDLVGFDITKISVEGLKKQFPEFHFHTLDISLGNTPLTEKQFDFISAFDVLYHIVEDKGFETALKTVHSLLKPGAHFIWSDNFLKGETLRETHQVSRSLQSIEKILTATGFQIVRRRPLFYLMNAPVDSSSPILQKCWKHWEQLVSSSERAGNYAGALLYPLEALLTSCFHESPSTEIMICRKND